MPQFHPPTQGDRILILREPWLGLVLSGAKTLEVRSRRLTCKTYFLGSRGQIYGSATISSAFVIDTAAKWRALLPQHRWDVVQLPYAATWGHRLAHVARAAAPMPFDHPRGAVGIVVYR